MKELADEDLKTAITNTFKDVKENMNIMKREMEHIIQIKLLQMKKQNI